MKHRSEITTTRASPVNMAAALRCLLDATPWRINRLRSLVGDWMLPALLAVLLDFPAPEEIARLTEPCYRFSLSIWAEEAFVPGLRACRRAAAIV